MNWQPVRDVPYSWDRLQFMQLAFYSFNLTIKKKLKKSKITQKKDPIGDEIQSVIIVQAAYSSKRLARLTGFPSCCWFYEKGQKAV